MRVLPHVPKLNPNQIESFFKKINKTQDGCWLWLGAKSAIGYGGFYVNNRYYVAHRVSYEHLIGKIPDGMVLDHLCRVRHCVNPAHLEPVTPQENSLRGKASYSTIAARTHCPKGHILNDTNSEYYTKDGYTLRRCLTCKKEKSHPKPISNHCSKGHPFNEINTYWVKKKNGKMGRQCKTCKYIFNQKYNTHSQIAS